jgi:hypothetical protein
MENLDEQKQLVGWCGAYCGICAGFKGRITSTVATDLKELIEGHSDWVPKFGGIDFDYEEFKKGLEYYSKETSGCYCQVPCKEGGGCPCKMRGCAKERGVEVCFDCPEYPCEHIGEFLKGKTPDRIMEYDRYKELGMEGWVGMNAERGERGFCRGTDKYYTRPKAG